MASPDSNSLPHSRPLSAASAADELELKSTPLEATLQLTEALATVRDSMDFASRALAALDAVVQLPATLLYEMTPAGSVLLASAGPDPEQLGDAVELLPAAGAEGQGLEVQAIGFHARLDPSLRRRLEAEGYRALLRLPLQHRQRRMGLLWLLLRAPRVLSVHQNETLLALGRVLGAALAAAQRRGALERELSKQRERAHEQQAALTQAEESLRFTEERYRQLAINDSLTGLYNSRHFHSNLETEVERARRYGDSLGLMLLDIDDFKRFNDAHGREAGDQVLARLGRSLRWSLRKIDSGFRYGGEEIAVILPRCDRESLAKLAERVRAAFEAETFEVEGAPERLTMSIGAAMYGRGTPLETFIRHADHALYEAKSAGKNRVVLVTSGSK
jgi:diguanylate cyclase (GGDEF)-like protein